MVFNAINMDDVSLFADFILFIFNDFEYVLYLCTLSI